MITEINRIGDFRMFKDWSPPTGTTFADVNVVYGSNGSGKSTLAALLAATRRGESSSAGLRVKVDETGNGQSIHVDDLHPYWQRLLVFNQGLVDRNLRFAEYGTACE